MVDIIISDTRYLDKLEIINDIEKDRIYCKHDKAHAIEVCKILTILSSRRELDNYKELSILMAYFHDVGRAFKYDGAHDKCSSDFTRLLLAEYGYKKEDIELICYAISNHSGRMYISDIYNYIDNNLMEDNTKDTWAKLLRIADQLSRNCYECDANDLCKWLTEEKTNEYWQNRI